MYWLDHNQSTTEVQKVFYADTEADIENLPTSKKRGVKQDHKYPDPSFGDGTHPVEIGSQCIVIDTGEVYMLKSDDTWGRIGG